MKIRSTTTIVPVVLTVLACWAGGALAQSYDAQTRTVRVAPSGSDDTRALATAFDVCVAVGPSCTVLLSEGRYFTRQQDVAGFRGTFAGAGMEATVIEPITPYQVSPARVDVSVRAPDPGGSPVMFTFRDADVTVRDVGFVVRDPAPSEPWFFGDLEIRALAVILDFEGEHATVELERVAIDAGPGVTFGASVFNGVFVLPSPEQSDATIVANVRVVESRIRGPLSGIAFGDLETSSVIVRGNVIEAGMAVEVANAGSSLVEVVGNELSGGDPAVVGLAAAEGRRLSGPTTLLMSGNSVWVSGNDRSSGLFLEDLGNPPHQRAIVIDNRFELDGSLAAVAGDADGAIVRDNVVTGTAASGLRVGGKSPFSFDGVARPWLVVGNDLSGLEPSGVTGVALRVTHRSRHSVVVCGEPASVSDGGTATVLLGCE